MLLLEAVETRNGAGIVESPPVSSILGPIDFDAGLEAIPEAKHNNIIVARIVDHYAGPVATDETEPTGLNMPRTYRGLLEIVVNYDPGNGQEVAWLDRERWIVARMYLEMCARAQTKDKMPDQEPSSRIHTPRLSLTAKQLQTHSY